ncbi:hypothetical protein QJS66_15880 [Kocuria rhizophila]|nr:hypothetical protein QJS66_15880 [Kocuria rhizophila]
MPVGEGPRGRPRVRPLVPLTVRCSPPDRLSPATGRCTGSVDLHQSAGAQPVLPHRRGAPVWWRPTAAPLGHAHAPPRTWRRLYPRWGGVPRHCGRSWTPTAAQRARHRVLGV